MAKNDNTGNRGFLSINEDKQRDIAIKDGCSSGGNLTNDTQKVGEVGTKAALGS